MKRLNIQELLGNLLPLLLMILAVIDRNLIGAVLSVGIYFLIKIYETLTHMHEELEINNNLLYEILEDDYEDDEDSLDDSYDDEYEEQISKKERIKKLKPDDADDKTWRNLMDKLSDNEDK